MIQFLRNILGLGPAEPTNLRKKPTANTQARTLAKEVITDNLEMDYTMVYPYLVSKKTKEIDLTDDLVSVFYESEDIYAPTVQAFVMMDKSKEDANGEIDVFHLKTSNKTEKDFKKLDKHSITNLDNLELPFMYWDFTDEKNEYDILSARITPLSSEKILSRKHMLEAHKMLNSNELLVSIPRKGLIYVCSYLLDTKHIYQFIDIHTYMILTNKQNCELLCEDLFVVKNGEISNVIGLSQLSDKLREGKL
ncbi:hypothetical protein JM80_0559 [Cellulophaga sp. RHA_52]|uniref:hypothetical protein n=1 Tax=Cellulophaga sp. RHA_52 TaxID=1250036 RepID=UPI00119A7B43|nr:hypothetical protein [Cellulophaga sp. RHA_52]TVZ08075.1 hypothetical protein JM80_0559 [Cellulophaga sp. RHA_52]